MVCDRRSRSPAPSMPVRKYILLADDTFFLTFLSNVWAYACRTLTRTGSADGHPRTPDERLFHRPVDTIQMAKSSEKSSNHAPHALRRTEGRGSDRRHPVLHAVVAVPAATI